MKKEVFVDNDGIEHDIVQPEELFGSIMERTFSNIRKIRDKKEFKTYLMFDDGSGLYKIGKAFDIEKRLKYIKGMCPMIMLVCVCERNVESQLHKAYKAKRKTGEWLKLDNSDVKYIKDKFKERNDYE